MSVRLLVVFAVILLGLNIPIFIRVECPACKGGGYLESAEGLQALNVSAAIALCGVPGEMEIESLAAEKILPIIGRQELKLYTPEECGLGWPLMVNASITNSAQTPLKGFIEVTATIPSSVTREVRPMEIEANTTKYFAMEIWVPEERIDYEVTVNPVGFKEVVCPHCRGEGKASLVRYLYFLLGGS